MNERNAKTSDTYSYKVALLTYNFEGEKENEQIFTNSKVTGMDIYEMMPIASKKYIGIGSDMLNSYLDSRATIYKMEYSYNIQKSDEIINGTISIDKTSALAGQTVTVTANPDTGKILDNIKVYKKGDTSTEVTVNNNEFVMPDYDAVVTASFKDDINYTNTFINNDTNIVTNFENEYDDRYKLIVDKIEISKEYENKNIVKLYNLKLVDLNGKEVSIKNTKVNVKIYVGNELEKYNNIKVIYIDGENQEEFACDVVDGYLTFTTSHLSNYAITGTLKVADEELNNNSDNSVDNINTSVENPKTYDGIINSIIIGIISAIGLLYIFVNLKRKRS